MVMFEMKKDCYFIAGEIGRLVSESDTPLQDLRYIVETCSTLWDMHSQLQESKVKAIVLKTKSRCDK